MLARSPISDESGGGLSNSSARDADGADDAKACAVNGPVCAMLIPVLVPPPAQLAERTDVVVRRGWDEYSVSYCLLRCGELRCVGKK